MKFNDFLQTLRHIPKPLLREQMLCILISLVLSALSFFAGMHGGKLKDGYQLSRDAVGGSEEQYKLSVIKENGETLPFEVNVSPVRHTKETADRLFNEIVSNIESLITDESQSLAALDHDIKLPREIPEQGIYLNWDFYPENPDDKAYRRLIDTDGKLHNEDLPKDCVVSGYLSLILSTYIVPDSGTTTVTPPAESASGTTILDDDISLDASGNASDGLSQNDYHNDLDDSSKANPDYLHKRYRSEPYKIYVNVVSRKWSEAESWKHAFQQALQNADQSALGDTHLVLPHEVAGQRLNYAEENSNTFLLFPFLGILAAFLLYFRQGSNQKDLQKKREMQLLLDYSELISKLMVYLGAGLTLRNSFLLISEHANSLVKRGIQENRALYDELQTMSNQFAKNIPESEIYSDFGRRVHLKPYTKLVSLIEQNRKNGSGNLRDLMEVEMNDAFTERKNTARRLGEEAGTKLLVPLFLLLTIVMIIVIVPALTSFHG